MRWYEAKLYALQPVGVDQLGKDVCEPSMIGTVFVRPAPWGTTAQENEGNAYDYVRRTFVSKAAHGIFDGLAYIEVQGEQYEVKEVSRSLNMTVVVAERYKVRL